MDLTRTQRWILSNQYKILEALYPEDADYLSDCRKVIECGYEFNYESLIPYIYSDSGVMSAGECREVIDILDMFSAIKMKYDQLSDKSGIEEWMAEFSGFDGNNETKQLSYACYLFKSNGGRFTELDRGDNNSHGPVLMSYRRMLKEWKNSTDIYNLSKDDIIRITSERIHPDNR